MFEKFIQKAKNVCKMCAKIMRFARLTKLFAQELSFRRHKRLNFSRFGHKTSGARKAPFHNLKTGVTHTCGRGVTQTYGIGVTHTCFEALKEGEKKKWKKEEKENGKRDVSEKMLTFAA